MGRTSDARERLMEAVHTLIWEYSYGAVTIDAICERAGVKKGSFYYFFSSKSDLSLAAINSWWVQHVAMLDEIFLPTVSPTDRLRHYFERVMQFQTKIFESSQHVLGCPLFTLGAEISTQDQSIRVRLVEMIAQEVAYFEQAIADGQARGEIQPGATHMKARALFSFYEGALTLARIENTLDAINTLGPDALTLIGARAGVVA